MTDNRFPKLMALAVRRDAALPEPGRNLKVGASTP
jgi:hypothetical protein